MFDHIGIERTHAFRAVSLGYVYLIFTTDTCMVDMLNLLNTKKSVVMKAMFKYVVFQDSDKFKMTDKHCVRVIIQGLVRYIFFFVCVPWPMFLHFFTGKNQEKRWLDKIQLMAIS